MQSIRLLAASIFVSILSVGLFAFADSSNPGAFVPRARTYRAWQGEFDVARLEMVMSKKLGYSQVIVTNIRWSRNPGDYLTYLFSKLDERGPVAFYVVTANVVRQNAIVPELTYQLSDVKFDLILLDGNKQAVLFDYDAKNLKDYKAIVPYADIDLQDEKHPY